MQALSHDFIRFSYKQKIDFSNVFQTNKQVLSFFHNS